MSDSLPSAYFEDVYRRKSDPWDFASSPYEAGKYQATLAALPRARYAHAFEAGCSIGVLTAQLAERCDDLLAADINENALRQAKERCAGLDHIRFQQLTLPADYPPETFELILLSEVGYYLSMNDLHRLRDRCITQLAPGGHLLLVHWTPFVPDYPLTGDQVHETFLAAEGLLHLAGHREEKYRLDLLARPDAAA